MEFLLKYEADQLIIDRTSPLDFEYFVFEFLKDMGFNPEHHADLTNGVDYDYIFLNDYKNYRKTLIEIKKYNGDNKVSVSAVQYLAGSMTLHNSDHGILIASSSFTPSAKDFVKSLDGLIELWDIEYLIKSLKSR
jgi:restriction endonuclease Mrr